MNTPADAWRRWFGLLFLILAFGMVVWGQTLLKPRLSGMTFLLYWVVCFLFTLLALLTALIDLLIVRRRIRKEQVELLAKAIGNASTRAPENSGTEPDLEK